MELGKNSVIYDEMKICAVCGGIFGRVRVEGEPKEFYQPCECDKKAGGPAAEDDLRGHLGLDFNEIVTLCYGCGQEVILSGSRWSPFFCEFCLGLMQFDITRDPRPSWWVPTGRHSMMNGLGLSGPDAQDEQKAARFVEAVNSLPERIEHLRQWKRLVVSRRREEAGFPGDEDIELAAYLAAVPRDNVLKYQAVLSLWDFFIKKFYRPGGKGENALAMDQEVDEEQIQYNPQKEIRCVFYALIVRNQALEEKYRGGLKGFLKRHGGEYNDDITTLCYMSPESGADVADLEANGLEEREDFIVLIDDLYGPRQSHNDFEPYPFDVPWLGGYYHADGVVVFSK